MKALITGATSGIGFQTAIRLAEQGHEILISGRSSTSGKHAVALIQDSVPNAVVSFVESDVSTWAGMQNLSSFAREIGLDVLVHNAGASSNIRRLTSDGLDYEFAVNVFAPWAISKLVWTSMGINSGPGRIICLAGGTMSGNLKVEDLCGTSSSDKALSGLEHYSNTKMAMIVAMRHLASQIDSDICTINSCYPGQASTRMTQGVTKEMLPVALRFAYPLFKFMTREDGGKSAFRASTSSVFLATDRSVSSISGAYFDKQARISSVPRQLSDATNAAEVLEICEGYFAQSGLA